MAKYELKKRTETDGEISYHILKDDRYVDKSFARNIEDAERLFNEFVNGKPSEPIIETIKEIEVNEN
jgi:hypothetical protein|tara:strand:+ start:4221 stop:4421 length:201 start_codon:yes stop_codon:yes gene_type:complete